MTNDKLHTPAPESYLDMTGTIPVTLRNDMMFHKVMEVSNNSLKGLVCALKGLDPATVKEVTLMNPIDYSQYTNKEIILDVKVLLNSNELLDIELQLYYCADWEKRSLLYLCRTYDSIGVSEKYNQLKPTTLIAIMDKPSSDREPEFYARYQLLNLKNHTPYSTLLQINVLYLDYTDLATKEDIDNALVYWAELFKATTWEEIKELAKKRPEFKEVATVMYNSNVQSQERTLFEAHQKFILDKISAYDAGYAAAEEKKNEEISKLNETVALQAEEIKKLQELLAEKTSNQ